MDNLETRAGLCTVWTIPRHGQDCAKYGQPRDTGRIVNSMDNPETRAGLCTVWKISRHGQDCVQYGQSLDTGRIVHSMDNTETLAGLCTLYSTSLLAKDYDPLYSSSPLASLDGFSRSHDDGLYVMQLVVAATNQTGLYENHMFCRKYVNKIKMRKIVSPARYW